MNSYKMKDFINEKISKKMRSQLNLNLPLEEVTPILSDSNYWCDQ